MGSLNPPPPLRSPLRRSRLLVLISVIVGAAGLAHLNSTGKEFVGVYGKDFADGHVNTSNFANTWLQGVLTAAFGVDIFFSYVSFRGKYKEQATNSFLLHPKKKSVLLAKTLCGGKKHMNFVNMNPYPGFPSKTFLESGACFGPTSCRRAPPFHRVHREMLGMAAMRRRLHPVAQAPRGRNRLI